MNTENHSTMGNYELTQLVRELIEDMIRVDNHLRKLDDRISHLE